MIRRISIIFFLFYSLLTNAQSFPYLNASTGNYGEFPVDKDTNIYMFHGNRLTKTDKNFNTIWANTYTGLTFSNILLSKTGSLFFIAGKRIGRIESNGVLSWCKDLQSIPATIGTYNFFYSTSSINSLLLDHSNNLIFTGNASSGTTTAFYLKTDTNGNTIKLVPFTNFLTDQLVITQDSAGYYRFFGTGTIPKIGNMANELGFTVFRDSTNLFVNSNYIQASYRVAWDCRYIRSRFNNGFYINMSLNHNYYYRSAGLMKCKKDGTPLWRLELESYNTLKAGNYSVIESTVGDIMLGLRSCCSYVDIHTGALKIDSNGVTNNTITEFLTSTASFNPSFGPLNYHYYAHSLQTIYGNKYYAGIDSLGSNFNPIILSKFSSPLSDTCHSSAVCTSTLFTSILQPYSTPTVQSLSSFTINSYASTITPVSFSIEFKYCTIHDTLTDVGFRENNSNVKKLKLSPNPTSTQLSIENIRYDNATVLDMFGKIVIEQNYHSQQISVQHLPKGLYFLRLRSDTTIYSSKFIKE